MTYFQLENEKGERIVDTFPVSYLAQIPRVRSYNNFIDITDSKGDIKRYRYGVLEKQDKIVRIITDKKKFINSKSLFSKYINQQFLLFDTIKDISTSIRNEYNAQNKEMVHNLLSLNSLNIQNLYNSFPQHRLIGNETEQVGFIREVMEKKPNVVGKTILDIVKNNMAMKIEFSVFNKLLQPYPNIQKNDHEIRDVVLNILQFFIQDLSKKRITPLLASCDKIIPIDFDTFSVSLFFIIENAVKYGLEGSQLRISFVEETNSFQIVFDMISISIGEDEVESICELGFRGAMAKKSQQKGMGVGMYRVVKTLELNDAKIRVEPRSSLKKKKKNDIIYERNKFIVVFENHYNWP